MIDVQPVVRIKAASARIQSETINASDLHEMLEPTQTVVRTFTSDKQLRNYRQMIYTINKQGTYRYRTMRDEQSMWGLVIWRMI